MTEDAFTKLLLHHIECLEDADDACREAAEGRRAVLQTASKAGINTTLLKYVTRARCFDQPVINQLRRYQEVAFSFMETPLGKAATTEKPARAKPAEEEAQEEGEEDETWAQPEDETEADELV
jgi:hypothetical protein